MRPGAAVTDEAVFEIVARLEIQKSLRLQYPVSLLTIRAGADPEAADLSGLIPYLARVIRPVIRGTDLVASSSTATGTVLQVLLVDAPHEALPAIVARIREEVSGHRFPADGSEILLAFGAATFPSTAPTLEQLRLRAQSVRPLPASDAGR